jgi:hypothetical protein
MTPIATPSELTHARTQNGANIAEKERPVELGEEMNRQKTNNLADSTEGTSKASKGRAQVSSTPTPAFPHGVYEEGMIPTFPSLRSSNIPTTPATSEFDNPDLEHKREMMRTPGRRTPADPPIDPIGLLHAITLQMRAVCLLSQARLLVAPSIPLPAQARKLVVLSIPLRAQTAVQVAGTTTGNTPTIPSMQVVRELLAGSRSHPHATSTIRGPRIRHTTSAITSIMAVTSTTFRGRSRWGTVRSTTLWKGPTVRSSLLRWPSPKIWPTSKRTLSNVEVPVRELHEIAPGYGRYEILDTVSGWDCAGYDPI